MGSGFGMRVAKGGVAGGTNSDGKELAIDLYVDKIQISIDRRKIQNPRPSWIIILYITRFRT